VEILVLPLLNPMIKGCHAVLSGFTDPSYTVLAAATKPLMQLATAHRPP
jgi:hypothetical protein